MKNLLTIGIVLLCLPFAQAQNDQDVPRNARDQQILDDLIVDGSICVGFDCVNGESFGFKTLRLKENNLRLDFDDTSTSASFPKNDWCIIINDSSNGGDEYFSVQDRTAGRDPFRIEAGAPAWSLFVKDNGNVGVGTNTPVTDIHVKTGNTPTLRLEQDGSSGFTPQTWDMAGNETNFFIRDVTMGSTLPFRIRPGAPTSSIDIHSDGVGIGSANPDAALHVKGDLAQLHIERTSASGSGATPGIKVDGAGNIRSDFTSTNNSAVQIRLIGDISNNRRIIGASSALVAESQIDLRNGVIDFYAATNTPSSIITPGNIAMTVTSSRSLKNNIKKIEIPDILDRIAEVPVTTYNWKRELAGDVVAKRENLGLIAQDFYTVLGRGKDTEVDGQDVIMSLWMAAQELHKNDQELEILSEEKDARITELENQVIDLTSRLDEISMLLETNRQDILLNGGDRAIIGQNYPNPYLNETVIEYYVPTLVKSAEIQFTDVAGKLIKKVSIQNGKGQINLKAQDLPQGNYHYSLIVDGEIVNTKQMILAK